jgi:hypothetical protein
VAEHMRLCVNSIWCGLIGSAVLPVSAIVRSIVLRHVPKATIKHEYLAVRVIYQSQIKEVSVKYINIGTGLDISIAQPLIRLLGIRRSWMPFEKAPLY